MLYDSYAPQAALEPYRPALVTDVLAVLLASLAIGLLARISVPIGPVPVTGQTLGVMLVAAALGRTRGTAAILAYLAEGAAGLPVFAAGAAGPPVLIGPTAGYLIGFIPAAWIIGSICDRADARKSWMTIAALCVATLVIYGFGTAWLSRFTGWDRVLSVGVVPFLFGDALKIGIVALAADRITSPRVPGERDARRAR